MTLEKYSMGIGDRFGCEAKAQLSAFQKASEKGIQAVPVWNKSFREHSLIGSQPADVRTAADKAVQKAGWSHSYYIDADHINLKNAESFVESSDFFTLDVADDIGKSLFTELIDEWVDSNSQFIGEPILIQGLDEPLFFTEEKVRFIAEKYLIACKGAGQIYRSISERKDSNRFIAEVSMDETDVPQSPEEIFLILSALAEEKIPVQTLAPRFSGRFNKGVEYVGDIETFRREFEADVLIIRHAVREFGLPENLKLSVHSGSDKFAIYPAIRDIIHKHNAGLHLKTAGTTWLEEVSGLARAGGQALEMAKDIYYQSLERAEELTAPYTAVIDIKAENLPRREEVRLWNGEDFARALRHNQKDKAYNPDFRQLIHVGYKIAAEMGAHFTDALEDYREIIAPGVAGNIQKHLEGVFG